MPKLRREWKEAARRASPRSQVPWLQRRGNVLDLSRSGVGLMAEKKNECPNCGGKNTEKAVLKFVEREIENDGFWCFDCDLFTELA